VVVHLAQNCLEGPVLRVQLSLIQRLHELALFLRLVMEKEVDNERQQGQASAGAGLDAVKKACTKCQRVYGSDGFYPGKCRFNLMSTCKVCTREKNNRLRKHALPVLKPDVTEKRCSRCAEMKPASSFFKSRGRASGLRSDCKDCEGAALRERKEKKRLNAEQPDKKTSGKPASVDHKKSSGVTADGKSYKRKKDKERGDRRLLCNLCKVRKESEEFVPRSSSKSALLVCISCSEKLEDQVKAVEISVENKTCFTCKKGCPASFFAISQHTADGLGVVCRDCRQDGKGLTMQRSKV
jgi:hypothetical protein